MLACVDVDYRDGDRLAVAACVLFRGWTDAAPARETSAIVRDIAGYVPGRFFERELPCLVRVLETVTEPLEAIVVDGYVWLEPGKPGLGARLHDALGGAVPVIGVAKNPFRGSPHAVHVLRGTSQKPLFVTAVGVDPNEAAVNVRAMHGASRIPTLLRRVDRLCRTAPAT